MLATDELLRYRRFKHPRAKLDYLTIRAACRKLLARELGCFPDQIEFKYGEHGKPYLSGKYAKSGIEFNTSHTDGLGLIAITRGHAIGVDIEKHRTNIEYEKLAQRYFGAAGSRGIACCCKRKPGPHFFSTPGRARKLT